MEKREATIPSKKEILESILKSCQRVMKEENDCFQKGEVEINYSALAEGLLKKYEQLIAYYPRDSSSEFSQTLKKKIEDIQHLKKPHHSIKLVSHISELLLDINKEE